MEHPSPFGALAHRFRNADDLGGAWQTHTSEVLSEAIDRVYGVGLDICPRLHWRRVWSAEFAREFVLISCKRDRANFCLILSIRFFGWSTVLLRFLLLNTVASVVAAGSALQPLNVSVLAFLFCVVSLES